MNAAKKEDDGNKAQRSVRNFFGRKEEEPTPVTSLKPMVLKPRVIHFNLMVAGLSGLGKVLSVTWCIQCYALLADYGRQGFVQGVDRAKERHKISCRTKESTHCARGHISRLRTLRQKEQHCIARNDRRHARIRQQH